MKRQDNSTGPVCAIPAPPIRRPYISLRELYDRTDVPDRYKVEVAQVIHGDGYGRVSRACRRALDRAGVGGVTLWEQP